jgi:hypothetical protein
MAQETCPQPGSPDDHGNAKEGKGNSRDDLGEEPYFVLDSRQLELGLPRHSNDTTHDRSITDSEDDTSTYSLYHKSRVEHEVSSLECIGVRGVDCTRNHVAVHATDGKLDTVMKEMELYGEPFTG